MSLNNRVYHLRGRHGACAAVPFLIVSPLVVWAAVALHSLGVAAQSSISVTTELVVLPVNVTDSAGAFVPGLEINNFRVLEDGQLQKITLFADEDNPVTVGLIVDRSRSMKPKLAGVAEAVNMFARSSNSEDEMFVVDFSNDVSLEGFGGKDFTTDAKELEKAVAGMTASGQTALYDAIVKGLDHLQQGHRDKKALVVVSDGGDNASRHKFVDVLNLASRSHAVIYAIGLVGDTSEEENPEVLKKLCRKTGGIAFFPRAQESVADASKKIARDLREQYTLGFAPERKGDREIFRKLTVEVAAPGRGKLRVRTRAGYFPEPKRDTPLRSGRSAP
jgi:Ca-activated chloride channel homolog